MSSFRGNDVLAKGFADKKCLAAMELMQQDPKKAFEKVSLMKILMSFLVLILKLY